VIQGISKVRESISQEQGRCTKMIAMVMLGPIGLIAVAKSGAEEAELKDEEGDVR